MSDTEEHDKFREQVRSVLAEVIAPQADDWEEQGKIPRAAWRQLADHRLLSLGHRGAEFLRSAVFLEELGRLGYAGVRAAIGVHAYMALSYLELFGTADQRDAYLPPAHGGTLIAALAISEVGAGSDLRHIRTTAKRHGDGSYRLNGEKAYVTNGSTADLIVTLARTDERASGRVLAGCSLLLVDSHASGVASVPQTMTGWRSGDIASIEFADVCVAENRILGRAGQALVQMMAALDFERLVAGLLAVGGVGYCIDLLAETVSGRQVRDAPLSANAAIRHQIAELESDYELVRHYAYHAARLQASGRLDSRTASILKLKATELAMVAARTCLQYQGARGYLRDSAAARLYRDAAGGCIAGGASELMREMIFELA